MSNISLRSLPTIVVDDGESPRPLTMAMAKQRQTEFGPNVAVTQKRNHWLYMLYLAIIHPFNWILLILGAISVYTHDYITSVLMAILIIVSTGLRFGQELKSEVAAETLISLIENYATVVRINDQGNEVAVRIPIEEVVVGDIQKLSAGDMIAGDIRVFSSKDLFVSQAALTGESLPTMKCGRKDPHYRKVLADMQRESSFVNVTDIPKSIRAQFEEVDRCFMGTSVISGTGFGEVVSIGEKTLYASISKTIMARRSNTAFQKGLLRVSYMFVGLMVVTLPLVLVMTGLLRGDWIEALEFAVAIALGLTPELLPAVVNANLSRGAVQMAKRQTIVKRIDSLMNFGGMDVLCTDKTGTLTKDKVSLVKYINLKGEKSAELMKMAYVNAHLQSGLRNLLDVAIEEKAHELDNTIAMVTAKWIVKTEIPFDFQRRRVSVIVEAPTTSKQDGFTMITKGAVEELLELCSYYKEKDNGDPLPLDEEFRQKAREVTESLNEDGLRLLAVATKTIPMDTDIDSITAVKDERDLVLLGFIAFLDPPKESAKDAVRRLQEHGVSIKVLTGDSPLICGKICKEIGMEQTRVLLGRDMEGLNEKELSRLVEHATIFAKLNPMQKATIIRMLKSNGHVVGFLGDGINDAPALREADVGISVDSGTAIAKETADMILLQKDLNVLVDGVRFGRTTYINTMKYLKISVSGSFGCIFSVVVATAWLPFLPMLPTHLVLQNIIYGIGQIAIPWDNVDEEELIEPKVWKAENVLSFMLFLGPVTTFFDLVTFAFLLYVTGWNTPTHETMFQSAWFLLGMFTEECAIHVLRSARVPFFKSHPSLQLIMATMTVLTLSLILSLTPLSSYVYMTAPDWVFWVYLPIALLVYGTACELVKILYLRIYKQWM